MKYEDREEVWIYGINPVVEAIKSGRKISGLFMHNQSRGQIRNIVDIAKSKNIPVKIESQEFFDNKFSKGHQGIAALAERKKTLGIEDLLAVPANKKEAAFFVILDCIEDPRNLGAILRVADAAGVHGIVFQSHRSAGITPVVAKSSAGAIEHINLVEVVNIKHAIDKMKKSDITIIGAEAGTDLTLWDIDMKVPLALVVGSEGRGLRKTVREMCDYVVKLPMKGAVNSLNVSVAAGVLSYEIMRQRRRDKQ